MNDLSSLWLGLTSSVTRTGVEEMKEGGGGGDEGGEVEAMKEGRGGGRKTHARFSDFL